MRPYGSTFVKPIVKFRKRRDGGWTFLWTNRVFYALRNGAGFAGRDWELWESGRAGDPDRMIADMLESREECVVTAREACRG